MTDMSAREYDHIVRKQRRLPAELERARQRVIHLEREAQRYGMHELLTSRTPINKAWDREVAIAKIKAGEA